MVEQKSDIPEVIDRVRVREIAGVFRARDALDATVSALLAAGFDRGDIDIMANIHTVRRRLGGVYAPAEDLADIPATPRRAFVAREDLSGPLATVAGLLAYVGATAAAFGVVASGGSLALALAAAAAGGAGGGGIGALVARYVGREHAKQLEAELAAGGIVLWVRVRSPEREEQARQILRSHGATAVRVHEIELEKRADDLPLSALRPDPWLGDEPLGRP